jgi:hypothetical protein
MRMMRGRCCGPDSLARAEASRLFDIGGMPSCEESAASPKVSLDDLALISICGVCKQVHEMRKLDLVALQKDYEGKDSD